MKGFTIALSSIGALLAVTMSARADAPLVGPFTRETYPQAVIDRPLTLPAGMVEGELGATFHSNTLTLRPGGSFGTTHFYDRTDDWDLDVDLRVGVTDRVEVEAGTSFSLDHVHKTNLLYTNPIPTYLDLRPSLTSWQRRVPFRLSFLALDTENLDTALTLTLPFEAFARRTVYFRGRFYSHVVTASSDGRVLSSVDLAAPTRWRLTPWLWLRAGQNLFSYDTFAQAAIFNFDVGLGVQAHPSLAFTLDTRVASVAFNGAGNSTSTTVTDRGTVDLEAIFTPVRCVDFVGGVVLPDFGRRFDDYLLRTAIRVRF